MRLTLKVLIPAALVSLLVAACGSSSKGSSASSATSAASSTAATTASSTSSEGTSALVKTASNATLGATVLTDSRGMTLYALSGEHAGKFICTSTACVGVWHPLSAAGSTPAGGVGSLGTVKRPDGTEQVTYKGMPLYTFASDQQPGDAKGEGIKDVGTWNAVKASASSASSAPSTATTQTSAPAAAAPPAETTPPAKSGGGYGY
jgi:predicted lipoprotein with Yx(FWY)xxD motif